VRILLVTQMWPSSETPDLGSFLVPIRDELERSGHEVEVVAISRRGGPPTEYAQLSVNAVAAALRRRPDVIFAHFLYPAGAAGALASLAARRPLVVMAHGQDVANLGEITGALAGTRAVVARARGVIANSRWLADRLVEKIPAALPKLEIANCGIDLDAFRPVPQAEARRALGGEWEGSAFVCVGSLIERKNVIRLADAFQRLGHGRLTFVGDGPLRAALEGRPAVTITGRIPQAEVPAWIAASDVLCQPSLIEPFGQATLEGMAMERSVVATRVGGPPEFVPPEAGVLVDPLATDELTAALERATAMPSPNPAARVAAGEQDVTRQAGKMAAVLGRAAEAGAPA
jgi:glycosyltransferase involved in cell wall biosynthesis